MRDQITIATKTGATDVETFWDHLETSLKNLKTDYIDLYQFHTPSFCPKPGDGTGLYEAMLEAKAQGKIRHIGITNHRLDVAEEAVRSGMYETLQFPFCETPATEKDLALVKLCREYQVGFIAMKGLSGGLLTRSDDAMHGWINLTMYFPSGGCSGKASWMNSSTTLIIRLLLPEKFGK